MHACVSVCVCACVCVYAACVHVPKYLHSSELGICLTSNCSSQLVPNNYKCWHNSSVQSDLQYMYSPTLGFIKNYSGFFSQPTGHYICMRMI